MAEKVLFSWIGETDLRAASSDTPLDAPISSTLSKCSFDRVILLCSYPKARSIPYIEWLKRKTSDVIESYQETLVSPVDFEAIFHVTDKHLSAFKTINADISILLSPGTPAMQAIWILLGKTKYSARFYQSSKEQGVQEVKIPFDISAEYTPLATKLTNTQLTELSNDGVSSSAAFENIITQNPVMQRLKHQAEILAKREVPVLIQGETGTGKELFARAIHNASARADKPFVSVNCGAFPTELVDSMLFGHKRGAFTGANSDHQGFFQQANGGTLFLDEFGELEPFVQVRLLRALQEGEVTPVGAMKSQHVDVRVICATHKDLMQAISEGTFREDLFYRIAIGVLSLPPLRERQGDMLLLIEQMLDALILQDSLLKGKKFSVIAKSALLNHTWPGNIRELKSTILRASLWGSGDIITAEDIQQAFFKYPDKNTNLLEKDVSQGIDIQNIISEVVGDYIPKALQVAQGKKAKAAELLGLNNHQTLDNWIKKHNVKL
ncbi:sigma-54 interaction domain-containing protein [Marinomonas aquiplantarum]|uniref:Fis family sigma54 specific transcriptional regulator n=1 Tax=Marinomonas aquiplantarum TaxID=491951 RepID=A0A366CU37_9GAMM|nr:sigma 54-interacting transcriptional regulator [Marinomonas aquiplantarum]RBO79588.1 Fis family sigma54 specific transcriptional regulator [Marinomonas aquiplantarum]